MKVYFRIVHYLFWTCREIRQSQQGDNLHENELLVNRTSLEMYCTCQNSNNFQLVFLMIIWRTFIKSHFVLQRKQGFSRQAPFVIKMLTPLHLRISSINTWTLAAQGQLCDKQNLYKNLVTMCANQIHHEEPYAWMCFTWISCPPTCISPSAIVYSKSNLVRNFTQNFLQYCHLSLPLVHRCIYPV